ncbi:hypothetical protein PISL3812_04045 [Talaromyces islandicus]|uniref:FAD-binding domain-containing protein n=1 Tax=Talaromyces islandicus TaxID=28573 RepID=A0A0U1LWJ5_TALIS|nr:hypothetical protein PISL3812_04045 [Talaromyces islandicus]
MFRSKLRAFLSVGINVEWSKRSTEVIENTESDTVKFEDGTNATGWLLIACDGAASRTRRYLHPSAFENLPVPVNLLGITVPYTPTKLAAALAIDSYFFQGTHSESNIYLYFSFLDSPTNMGNDTGNYICQVISSWAETKDIAVPKSNAERIALVKHITTDWTGSLRGFIGAIPDDAGATPINVADWFLTTKREHGRVVLMGDAAHTMTMFRAVRGESGNNAVADANDFAKRLGPLITSNKGHPWSAYSQALAKSDQDVFVRGKPCVMKARRACLDAHDFASVTKDSPLVSRRSK